MSRLQSEARTSHALGLLPLPEGERGGVRGYDISINPIPLTRPPSAVDLSPPGRGGAVLAAKSKHIHENKHDA
jgi:hypothetical protein